MRGWLIFFPHDDRRRLLVAFALALALHEIIAGLIPRNQLGGSQPEKVIAQVVRIVHRPTPRPIRTPTPRPPTPKPVIHAKAAIVTPQPIILHLARAAAASSARGAKRRSSTKRRHAATVVRSASGIVAAGGQGTGKGRRGSGAGSGAGIGVAGNGAGASGPGTGASANGSGGQPPGEIPCGFVGFTNINRPHPYNNGKGFAQDIRMEVTYKDGHVEKLALDYPFVYPDEGSFPWSDANSAKNPPDEILFQPPPPDKETGEPPIVKYVEHHSPGGLTTLDPCPGDKP